MSDVLFYYDMTNPKSWKGGPTTNLIPSGTTNSYPSYGNGHGTFNTNKYNSNTSFNIGTIDNVTDNLVTLSTVDYAINTYDVLNPDTTGGGVTAGTDYWIRKHSDTTFSLHTYNSLQNGNQGGLSVFSDIWADNRVAINATSFPTMWHGAPHRANSGLVKEIIPNGFKYNGREHDCVRCHTEHRVYNGGGKDYMAYGVYPQAVSGNTYAFSCKVRAGNERSIGKTVQMTAWATATFPVSTGSKSIVLTEDWQQIWWTGVAPGAGNINLYFPSDSDTLWDISEIQVEDGSVFHEYTEGTRSNTEAVVDLSGQQTITALNLTYNSDSTFSFDGIDDYMYIANTDYPAVWDDKVTIEVVMMVPTGATWGDASLYQGIVARGAYDGVIGLARHPTDGRIQMNVRSDGAVTSYANAQGLARDTYYHIVGTWDGSKTQIYVNGVKGTDGATTAPAGVPDVANWHIGGNTAFAGANGGYAEGEIPFARVYKKVLTEAEIKRNYASLRGKFGV